MQRDAAIERRHYRLGPLTVVTEATVPVARFARWLPRTGDSGDTGSVAALWVGGSTVRDSAAGGARLIAGGVALWMDEPGKRASLLSSAGRADLDLDEHWGRVCPREGTSDLGPILTATAAMLLGRASAVLLDASGIIDRSGGAWMIVGARADRSWLTREFVGDGCEYLSDDQLIVRRSDQRPGTVIVESWHRASAPVDDAALPASRWRSRAELRGVLIARASTSRVSPGWHAATRDEAIAALTDSARHLLSDPAMTDALRAVLAKCARHVFRPVIR